MSTYWVTGNSASVVAVLPDESVDLIVTSTPYLRKVSYLPADHPDKPDEVGIEETPGDFIESLLACAADWWRILRPGGSICVDLGDTFSGSGGAGGDHNPGGMKEAERKYKGTGAAKRQYPDHWPEAKSLCMVPEAFRIGLAYGFNPLPITERLQELPQLPHWTVRNVVTLCQRNPKPGRQGDKFWPATTDLVIACKGERYWHDDYPNPCLVASRTAKADPGPAKDWWVYANRGPKGHPASWPAEILKPLILSMTSPGAVVLDPFAGSGMTVRVAADLGRIGIGIDLSEEYLRLAQEEVVGIFLNRVSPDELATALRNRKVTVGT